MKWKDNEMNGRDDMRQKWFEKKERNEMQIKKYVNLSLAFKADFN